MNRSEYCQMEYLTFVMEKLTKINGTNGPPDSPIKFITQTFSSTLLKPNTFFNNFRKKSPKV